MFCSSVFLLLLMFFFALNASASTFEQVLNTIVNKLLRPAANLLFVLATLVFIWGVIEYIAGSSNDTARTTGRSHIVWGLIGLMIMTGVYFILSILKSVFYSS